MTSKTPSSNLSRIALASRELNEADRWALVVDLLESLTPAAELAGGDVSKAWLAESHRRLASFDAGEVELEVAADVHARSRALLD